jgi:hypothetical protein
MRTIIQNGQVLIFNGKVTTVIRNTEIGLFFLFNCKEGEEFFLMDFKDLEEAIKTAKRFVKSQTKELNHKSI